MFSIEFNLTTRFNLSPFTKDYRGLNSFQDAIGNNLTFCSTPHSAYQPYIPSFGRIVGVPIIEKELNV